MQCVNYKVQVSWGLVSSLSGQKVLDHMIAEALVMQMPASFAVQLPTGQEIVLIPTEKGEEVAHVQEAVQDLQEEIVRDHVRDHPEEKKIVKDHVRDHQEEIEKDHVQDHLEEVIQDLLERANLKASHLPRIRRTKAHKMAKSQVLLEREEDLTLKVRVQAQKDREVALQ